VLSLIAKINRKQLPVGRLVTAEEKERLLKEGSPSQDESTTSMLDHKETKAKEATNGTLTHMESNETLLDNDKSLPNMDNNELTIISSDNEPDSELLLNEHTHRRTQIMNKVVNGVVNYYHWILILFKNGWWRTTLLLWFLW